MLAAVFFFFFKPEQKKIYHNVCIQSFGIFFALKEIGRRCTKEWVRNKGSVWSQKNYSKENCQEDLCLTRLCSGRKTKMEGSTWCTPYKKTIQEGGEEGEGEMLEIAQRQSITKTQKMLNLSDQGSSYSWPWSVIKTSVCGRYHMLLSPMLVMFEALLPSFLSATESSSWISITIAVLELQVSC